MKNENLNSKIGEWLQNKRIEKGLSQQDVADAMNITRTAVHYWESGKRTIYAENMFDYCRVHSNGTTRTFVHGHSLLLVRNIKKPGGLHTVRRMKK